MYGKKCFYLAYTSVAIAVQVIVSASFPCPNGHAVTQPIIAMNANKMVGHLNEAISQNMCICSNVSYIDADSLQSDQVIKVCYSAGLYIHNILSLRQLGKKKQIRVLEIEKFYCEMPAVWYWVFSP